MDPITHGILGAATVQSALGKGLPRGAALIGALGAMAPDLDVFILSFTDPTVAWQYHRHFTHSLILIPLGGLIAAIPFLLMKRFKDYKRKVILTAILGYATHTLLDMLTSYGTQVFWPFTNDRVAIDWMGIVDPVYTLLLLTGVILTSIKWNPKYARGAFALGLLYVLFGGWQHHRAVEAKNQIAAMRGHQTQQWRVMPAPGWLALWRSVYITDGRLYADGIRTPWIGAPLTLAGGSVDAITFDDLPDAAKSNAESVRRFQILNWFASGFISPINQDASAVGDERITSAVESLTPMWGLEFDPATGAGRGWRPSNGSRDFTGLIRTLIIGDPRYQPLGQ